MKDVGIRIIGSGCAGMGAAWQLSQEGIQPVIYESHPYPGGHTATWTFDDGFVFDEGPHISFTKIDRIKNLFAESVQQDFQAFSANVNNYWQGHWIKHPAQVNLAGLPPDVVVNCIRDFVDAQNLPHDKIQHYQDWLYASFGKTFADTFPAQYTRKYHTTDAKNLTTDWLGPRLYRPDLNEVLYGALTKSTPNVHYIPDFRYPSHGGFVSYLKKFQEISEIHLNHKVVGIDTKARTLTFGNGKTAEYKSLVSSVPLPVLVPLIKDAPKDVLEAASLLSCTKTVLVNIGIDREEVTDQHWTYFYDDEYPFARLSFPYKYSPHTVPPGKSSIQAEIYFSDKWKPMTGGPDSWIEPTIEGLLKCGLVRDRSEIIHTSTLFAPWGNVIFDYDRPRCLKLVHDFLDSVGIAYCGRYGDWAYIWTDESFVSGEQGALKALSMLTR